MPKKYFAQILFEVELAGVKNRTEAKNTAEDICDFLIHDWLNEDEECANIININIIQSPSERFSCA